MLGNRRKQRSGDLHDQEMADTIATWRERSECAINRGKDGNIPELEANGPYRAIPGRKDGDDSTWPTSSNIM
jgi:hypothetical protein